MVVLVIVITFVPLLLAVTNPKAEIELASWPAIEAPVLPLLYCTAGVVELLTVTDTEPESYVGPFWYVYQTVILTL